MNLKTFFFMIIWLIALAGVIHAHEVRPACLELRQTGQETYEMLWKVPARSDQRLGIYVHLPDCCERSGATKSYATEDAFIERWTVRCKSGLVGQCITIDGLDATLTEVLVRLEWARWDHTDSATNPFVTVIHC
ncbi:MAG: hypothetical protein E3K36_08770 [Candidatus Brocadia sp.]|nr:hypothetical protein [Candidatus Brocadia sp.]